MHPVPLPCRAQNLGDGSLEAFLRIGKDELDAALSWPRPGREGRILDHNSSRLGLAPLHRQFCLEALGVAEDRRDRQHTSAAPEA